MLIVANVGGTVAQTVPEIEAQYGADLQLFDRMDAATRTSRAPRQEARWLLCHASNAKMARA